LRGDFQAVPPAIPEKPLVSVLREANRPYILENIELKMYSAESDLQIAQGREIEKVRSDPG
jgi:hypothetical protein